MLNWQKWYKKNVTILFKVQCQLHTKHLLAFPFSILFEINEPNSNRNPNIFSKNRMPSQPYLEKQVRIRPKIFGSTTLILIIHWTKEPRDALYLMTTFFFASWHGLRLGAFSPYTFCSCDLPSLARHYFGTISPLFYPYHYQWIMKLDIFKAFVYIDSYSKSGQTCPFSSRVFIYTSGW